MSWQQLIATSAIILAGGQSRRLGPGKDKAWLKVGGQAIIQRVLARLRPLFTEVIIVGPRTPRYQELGLRIVPDELPGKGPLGGLYSGLRAISNDWAFCCACDMPFLNQNLIAALLGQVNQTDVVICQWAGRLQPLHSLYSQACLPVMQQNLQRGQNRLLDILPSLRVKYLEEDFIAGYEHNGDSFMNLNTPEALNRANKMLKNDPENG